MTTPRVLLFDAGLRQSEEAVGPRMGSEAYRERISRISEGRDVVIDSFADLHQLMRAVLGATHPELTPVAVICVSEAGHHREHALLVATFELWKIRIQVIPWQEDHIDVTLNLLDLVAPPHLVAA